MRVVTCTKHYYRKHGKWPTTRQLAENYKGVRSDGLWWSSWSWWRSWEEEAVSQGLLTVGKRATPEKKSIGLPVEVDFLRNMETASGEEVQFEPDSL